MKPSNEAEDAQKNRVEPACFEDGAVSKFVHTIDSKIRLHAIKHHKQERKRVESLFIAVESSTKPAQQVGEPANAQKKPLKV